MRDKLIQLSIDYEGDYSQILKHLHDRVVITYKLNCDVVTILDDDYPFILKQLHNPPLVLFYKGDLKLLSSQIFAIVGSRKHTSYSKTVCQQLIKSLKNVTIVSGLAYGLDSIAHRAAIINNLKTIAVIGSGFDNIYPSEHVNLAKIIGQNHLLISEYPPHAKAKKHCFVMRNRLIACLCERLYVLQAAQKSGTKITAEIALELGRDIYCVAGSVFDEHYQGNHELINDGAFLIEKI